MKGGGGRVQYILHDYFTVVATTTPRCNLLLSSKENMDYMESRWYWIDGSSASRAAEQYNSSVLLYAQEVLTHFL